MKRAAKSPMKNEGTKKRKLNSGQMIAVPPSTMVSTTPRPHSQEIARIIQAMISRIASAPSDVIQAELGPYQDLLAGLSNKDVQTIAFVLKTLDRFQTRSYLDYIYFLLHPISSPRKCRPPGMLTNPLGTEIRCIKGYNAVTTTSGQETLLFTWIPQRYRLDTTHPWTGLTEAQIAAKFPANTDAATLTAAYNLRTTIAEYENFFLGTEAGVQVKVFGPGAPNGYANHFKAGRLIAAELQITVIQSQETNQGRFVISPIYDSGVLANEDRPQIPTTVKPTSLDSIFDNKIVYENHVSEGVRAVYFPVHTANFDFHSVSTTGTSGPHDQRMIYQGSIRAIPVGSRVEIRTAMYFELTVAEQSYEIIADPTDTQVDLVTGSIQNVMDGLQHYAQDMGGIISLKKEEALKRNTRQMQTQGLSLINQYGLV